MSVPAEPATLSATVGRPHKCVCKACTCGKHKCKVTVQNNTKLEGTSEYTTRYQEHALPTGPRLKYVPSVHVPVGAPLSSATENRDQYKQHQLPPKFPKKKPDISALYENSSHFEGLSISKDDYKAWPVKPRQKPAPRVWKDSGEHLSGETTNAHDYKQWPVPPPYVKKRAEYVPSAAKMDGISTSKEAFQPWAVSRPAQPPVAVYRQASEDRDFKSTTRSSFVPHPTARRKITAVEYHPVVTTFEGATTNKSDYKQWPVSRRIEYKSKYVPPPSAALDGHTTYGDAYLPKAVPRYVHEKLKYVKPDSHFEGQSTQRSDYSTKPLSTRVDFAPRNIYNPEPDARDFMTQTHLAHNQKPLVVCEVVRRNQVQDKHVSVGKDGHQYWDNSGSNTPPNGVQQQPRQIPGSSLSNVLAAAEISRSRGSGNAASLGVLNNTSQLIKPPTPPFGLAKIPGLPSDPIAPTQRPHLVV